MAQKPSQKDSRGKKETRLIGRWIHAHEEDKDGQLTFRREGTPLPPSRGRTALILEAGGQAKTSTPGPDDKPVGDAARWQVVDDDRLVLKNATPGRDTAYKIASISDDKLVLKREG